MGLPGGCRRLWHDTVGMNSDYVNPLSVEAHGLCDSRPILTNEIHPTAKVSEQVNRKCPHRNTILLSTFGI